jgi:hypothetical protein
LLAKLDSPWFKHENDNKEDKGKEEILEVEFATIKAILNQGDNINDSDKNREVNKDD